MKRFMQAVFIAIAIAALASISLANDDQQRTEKERVEFFEDVMVNGTLLEAGTYDIRFEESTGELAVLKNGKVKAKTAARVEARTMKAKNTSVRTRTDGGVANLIGVTFDGWSEEVVVTGSSSMSGSQ
jgi:hypothetical protein